MKSTVAWLVQACAALMLLAAGPVFAQATRTWVSGVGDDANPCSRTAPCKTFAGAISKTATNGIINCLDPGGFGAVTITKSITLDCAGIQGGVLASLSDAINISVAAADRVTLRGLSIEGVGSGLVGVDIYGGGTVTIEQSRIYGFRSGSAIGVRFTPSAAAQLIIQDSVIADNTTGVLLRPAVAGRSKVSLRRVSMTGNVDGLVAEGMQSGADLRTQLSECSASNNSGSGLVSRGYAGASSLMADGTQITNNGGFGVVSEGANSQVILGRSVIADNSVGVATFNSGALLSYKDNSINRNPGGDGTPIPGLPGN